MIALGFSGSIADHTSSDGPDTAISERSHFYISPNIKEVKNQIVFYVSF